LDSTHLPLVPTQSLLCAKAFRIHALSPTYNYAFFRLYAYIKEKAYK
jgi:hypothetical protein